MPTSVSSARVGRGFRRSEVVAQRYDRLVDPGERVDLVVVGAALDRAVAGAELDAVGVPHKLLFLGRDGRAVVNSRVRKYPERDPAETVDHWVGQIRATEELVAELELGSVVIDANKTRLDARFIDDKGNVLDFDYRIREGRHDVARVSKKFFRVRDSYGVEIQPEQNEAFILALAVALDMMAHN